ncbi:unnamed protein product [Cyprideis torosa]|uniref:Uncharacterized protein n=1 Tax=Cyprideis torosa TaxID=163714 RepID=A0A7R8W3W6_9CRUS|nr:unnamed protein product [Cyprideis torosa]CAG0883466.1 unnamed protein product [Cyprideis torosa]
MKLMNERSLAAFATSLLPVDKEGFLWKRGEVNKQFQKRWFVLRGNLLFYFDKFGSCGLEDPPGDPLGMVILEDCTVELCDDILPFCFRISFIAAGSRTYVFASDTQNNLEDWVRLMSNANNNYIRVMTDELQRQIHDLKAQQSTAASLQQLNLSADDRSLTTNSNNNTATCCDSYAARPPPGRRRYNPFSWEGSFTKLSLFSPRREPVDLFLPRRFKQPFSQLHRDLGTMVLEDRKSYLSKVPEAPVSDLLVVL